MTSSRPTHTLNAIVYIATYALLTGVAAILPLAVLAQTVPHAVRAVAKPSVKSATAHAVVPAVKALGDPVTLNFQAAEIEAVARTMATITGKNVVVDPRVKGTMTLLTDRPISRAEAMAQFVSALRLQSFTLIESAGLYRIVPEADAKLQTESVTVSDAPGDGLPSGNQIATQIYKLNFESANNLVPLLRPLISPNNTINANPTNNSLVITDYADNLRRMARIIAVMDVANATDVQVLQVKHAIATDLASLVLRLIGQSATPAPAAGDLSFKTTLIAEPRSNTLILRAANAAQLALVISLVDKLDQPDGSDNGDAGNIHVVYLKNADATKLATTLRAAVSAQPNAAQSAPTATGGQIQADVPTNALIITASEPQYRQLRAVIDRLDARRAQVFVESMIAEVRTDRAAEFGIQWQGALGKAGDGVIGLLGSNFGATGKNIINLATGAAAGTVVPGHGANFGAAQQTNGVYVLGFLANFLETTGSGNVLSTPNLLTLDNEEAKITIGQNVPFVTGQFTSTGTTTSGTVNPFQTIERKDVGLTLKVKPQISENGTVRLSIFQEVSSVASESANGPTTNKRTIETNVVVDDGAVVVLGGLLQDDYSGSQEKVPGLGDLPFFGNLFKSEARARKKTNLMVFLRPMVVRDARSTDRLSMDRYEQMRSGLEQAQPAPSAILPINAAPTLPALTHSP